MSKKVFFYFNITICTTISLLIALILWFYATKITYYNNAITEKHNTKFISSLHKNKTLENLPEKYSVDDTPEDKLSYYKFITLTKENIKIYSEDEFKSEYHKNSVTEFLHHLKDAEEFDPDNALYNYYRCYALASEAIIEKKLTEEEQDKFDEIYDDQKRTGKITYFNFHAKDDYNYKLIDEKKLAQAIVEYKKGLAKPYCKTYEMDDTKQALYSADVKATNIYNFINIMGIKAQVSLPYIKAFRDNVKIAKFYAKTQYDKGNYTDAEKILSSGKILVQQSLKSDYTLVNMLVDLSILSIEEQNKARFYHNTKQFKKEKIAAKKFAQLIAMKEIVKAPDDSHYDNTIKKYGATLSLALLELNYGLSEIELAHELQGERVVSAKLVEQQMIAVIFTIFMILFAIIIAVYLIEHKVYHSLEKYYCYFIVPKLSEIIYILLGVFIIPVAIYLLVANYNLIANKEAFSYFYTFENKIQSLLFLITIFYPTIFMVSIIVRRFCKQHNLAFPKKISTLNIHNIVYYAIIIFLSTPFIWQYLHNPNNPNNEAYNVAPENYIMKLTSINPSLIIIILAITIYLLVIMVCNLIYLSNHKNNPYRQLLFGNIIFYMGFFAIISTAIIYGVSTKIEEYYFSKDTAIFVKDDNTTFTGLEKTVMTKLEKALQKYLKQ